MSFIRIQSIEIENYRSFGPKQSIQFPDETFKKPISIVGYNNSGKTNLMNALLYGVGASFVSKDTFELADIHNLDRASSIKIQISCNSSEYENDWGRMKSIGNHTVFSKWTDGEIESGIEPSLFGATKHYGIFNINFHEIKDEISTNKTSWGNMKSFLGKHIKNLVETDTVMSDRADEFIDSVKQAKETIFSGSSLEGFVEKIKQNYKQNLRNNDFKIDFTVPEYEDLFLHMLFKIGLNGSDKLVPIDHFGDGYISMFVMAVIQAIAETTEDDKCLFLFEEPESFLHENHQEYFYKVVLCGLAEKGHQVIYTTHSHKMVDMFDTRGLIRLELDQEHNHTVVKFNKKDEDPDYDNEVISIGEYNQFVKSIEPNLNKILFSKKVVLVEGPNDLMVYDYLTEQKVKSKIQSFSSIQDKDKYASAYLNYNNIAIIPHHGKSTAYLLMKLCKFLEIDYYVINDWDITDLSVDEVNLPQYGTINALQASEIYSSGDSGLKAKLTTNWRIQNHAVEGKMHFNEPKLERLVDDGTDFGKDSSILWRKLQNISSDNSQDSLFPDSLTDFLEINSLEDFSDENDSAIEEIDDDLPF